MNKVVVITGSTGGLGSEMAKRFVEKGYDLILLNRNKEKTDKQIQELKAINDNINIRFFQMDLTSIDDVKKACEYLENTHVDIVVLNAAIYNVPIKQLELGYNNIFQVNFITQFYMLKRLKKIQSIEKFLVIGSIAYKFAERIDEDIDYSHHTKINRIYGNSKRFLMFSVYKEMENDSRLVISHPGIVYTNITNHYHRLINWFITLGIKILFPSAKKASKVLIGKLDDELHYLEWVCPKVFNLWGGPKIRKIKDVKEEDINFMHKTAVKIYEEIEHESH